MNDSLARRNVYLTDENVNGPAIELARLRGVQVIRDVDTEIPCHIRDYDQCLFDYGIEHGFVVVTGNIRHFEPKFYAYAETGGDHPGLVLIRPEHRTSSVIIAEWLELWSDEDLTNRIVRLPPD
jgi:hypothetical protein